MSLRRSASHGMLLGIVAGVLIVLLVFAWMLGYTLLDKSSKDSSSSSPSATSSGPMPKTSAALARFYDQSLTWKKCQGGECSWLTVPLDYADPDGKTIKIAVNMVAAKDKSPIGDLVVNPGGPGQSGMQYAAAASYVFRSALTNHFNIVGFDPRGIGASDPLKCWGTKDMDAFVAADPAPQTPAARAAMDRQVHAFGESCLKNSGALAEHMSTEEVARDVDILRAALKQPKLDYFGASYGTFLGATYANLFPKNVGRMVLDGALDPTLSNEQLNLAQAHGFEVAMRSYIKDCVSKGHCVLGNSVEAGVRTVKALIAAMERDRRLGAVGPRVEDSDGTLYPSARQFPDLAVAAGHAFFGYVAPRNRWTRAYRLLDWDHSTAGEVDWVSGSCLLVRRSRHAGSHGRGPYLSRAHAHCPRNCRTKSRRRRPRPGRRA